MVGWAGGELREGKLMILRVTSAQCTRGKAKQYPYYEVRGYEPRETRDGRIVGKLATGMLAQRRSLRLAENDAERLAEERGWEFLEGYGSLHGKPWPEGGKG